MKKNILKSLLYGCLIIISLTHFSAVFASVAGSWKVTFFLEPTRYTGSTQCVTFTLVPGTVNGISTSGTWTSPSFPGWSGQWIQHGDYIRWFGVVNGVATSEAGFMPNNNNFGGISYNHFSTADGTTITSGSWIAVRVNKCDAVTTLRVARVGTDPAIDPAQRLLN